MQALGLGHLCGLALTLIGVTALGIYSGRRVKNAADFASGGGKAGVGIVAGTIMGTLVGGASTVGTAQLAFRYGLSALWFTLGAGLGCAVLALFFALPLRKSGCRTLQQLISREYGRSAGALASVLGLLGMVLSVVAQLLAAVALLRTLLPLAPLTCSLLAAVLMACYVLFGGVWGTGLVGSVKSVLLYVAAISGGALVLWLCGGLETLTAALPKEQYFNLFARGLGVDLGAALSLILGVLATQTYAQAVLSARDDKTALRGALGSAFLIPPIGLGGTLIGLYMRVYYPLSDAAQAFPQFVLLKMPPFLGGVVLATLLVAIVGTGAGIALGVGTVITGELYVRLFGGREERSLLVNRLSILAVLAGCVLFTLGDLSAVILSWSFLSMGLRAASVFCPMCAALFFPDRVRPGFALVSIAAGPLVVLFAELFLDLPFDPLFLGIAAGALVLLAGKRAR